LKNIEGIIDDGIRVNIFLSRILLELIEADVEAEP